MTGKTIEVTCKCCPDKFTARVADRNRGWAQFCSKSCAAFFKAYGKRRGHQTAQMRAVAAVKNQLERERRSDYCADEFDSPFGEFEDHNKD